MKKQKGITLIALVITIIVLLILAGVTISMVLGDNGVLTKATQSKEKTSITTEQEQVSVAATGARMDNEDDSDLWITEENFEKELNAVIGERDVDYTLEEYGYYYYKVTYVESGRSYYVDANNGETKTEEEALIEFTIGDETYYAIEGMTWEEWLNSDWNTDVVWDDGTNMVSIIYEGYYMGLGYINDYGGRDSVFISDEILNQTYFLYIPTQQ